MAKLKDGFYKQTAETIGSDLYVLLAGGGSKPLEDFATSDGNVTSLGTSGNYLTWTKGGVVNNLTVPYATSSNYSRNLLGRTTSGSDYSAADGNLVFAEWNTHNDSRWCLKAKGYETRVGYANDSDKLDGYQASSFYVQGLGEVNAQEDLQTIPKDTSGGWQVTKSGWAGMVAVLAQGHTASNRAIGFLFKGGQSSRINLLTQVDSTWYDRGVIAYISDIPTKTSQLTNDSGYLTSASLNNYVTLNTEQTITGLKTFESDSSSVGVSLILKNKGWSGGMSTAIDFYNGKNKTVPSVRISDYMQGDGSSGGTLRFYTQEKSTTNPNPNGLTERMRITNIGTIGIGTVAPEAKVHIDAGATRQVLLLNSNHSLGPIMYFQHNNEQKAWFGYSPGLKGFYIFNSNDTGILINDSNNVGIGTTTVNYKLHVNGKVASTGFVKSDSSNSYVLLGGGGHKLESNLSVSYASDSDKLDGIDSTGFLRKVTVANNAANDFNTFESMTLTGRGVPTTGASLSNAPWSGQGPAGGYGVLTYLWSSYGTQIAWGYNSNRIYIRPKYYSSGAVWSSTWDSLALTSEIPTKTSQLTNDSGFVTGGPYLPLTGGTIYNSNIATPLYIKGPTTSAFIGFQDKDTKTMGFIGMSGENSLKFCKSNGTTNYDILHTGNSGINDGTITINGTSITPLTSLPSHTHNYIPFEQSVNTIDMNTVKTTGFYYGYNMTNSASTNISSFIVARYSHDWGSQIQMSSDQRMYIRFWQNAGGVMQNWKTLAYISDIPTVTNYYWADIKISATSSTTTSPTVNSIKSNGYSLLGQCAAAGDWTGGTANSSIVGSSTSTIIRSSGDDLYHYHWGNAARYKILDSNNSSVSGGGSSWGSSITVKINGTSKTLTIPSNPNTDLNVYQSSTTTSNYRPVVLGLTSSTSTSSLNTAATGQVYVSTKFYAQPSTGSFYATAFYESSDEHLKDFENDIDINFNAIRAIPKKYFRWKERPDDLQIGTSAQVVQKFYPALVSSSVDGYLSVDYAKLSVIALKAIDELYNMILGLRAENSQLREQIRQMQK